MHIDLGSGRINVKFAGEEYEISEPTLDDIKAMQDDEDKEQSMINFMVRLGFPETVVKKMGALTLKRFMEALTAPLLEKK